MGRRKNREKVEREKMGAIVVISFILSPIMSYFAKQVEKEL